MIKRIRLLLMALVAVVGIGWLLAGAASDGNDEETDLVATATVRDIESELILTGEIAPEFQIEIKPEVGGKVKEILVHAGQFVKQGELMAVIDDTDLLTEKDGALTEIEGAKLAADKNRGNYDRAKQLFESKLISKEVYANLEADLAIAENNLDKAERRLQAVEDKLRKTKIQAPADGTVLTVQAYPGQVVIAAASVNSGTTLMTFANLRTLLITSHINQVDASLVKPGMPATITLAASNKGKTTGAISFVAPVATVKNNVKGFEVQATVEGEVTELKPGMSVSLRIPVGKAEKAVSVPIAAVFSEDDEKVVYVRKGSSSERRRVSVGVTSLRFAEITSGISEGEEILLVEPALLKKRKNS